MSKGNLILQTQASMQFTLALCTAHPWGLFLWDGMNMRQQRRELLLGVAETQSLSCMLQILYTYLIFKRHKFLLTLYLKVTACQIEGNCVFVGKSKALIVRNSSESFSLLYFSTFPWPNRWHPQAPKKTRGQPVQFWLRKQANKAHGVVLRWGLRGGGGRNGYFPTSVNLRC